MERATTWRSSWWARWLALWARLLGWTLLYNLVLCGVLVVVFACPVETVVLWGLLLGLLVVAFLIGVRFRSTLWGLGPPLAIVLAFFGLLQYIRWNPPYYTEVVWWSWTIFNLMIFGLIAMIPFSLAGLAGVWWGDHRHATAPESERLRVVMVSIVAGLGLLATVGYAVREFKLDEARTRIAAGSGGTPDASVVHAVTGTVVIESSQHFGLEGSLPYHVGDPCHGDASFDDIRAGAEVRALDGNGSIVGLGRLSTGVLTDGEPVRVCQFSWTMAVDDAELYAFKIAHWQGPSFSRAELEAVGWTVSLSI
jgi:hypothetical protein